MKSSMRLALLAGLSLLALALVPLVGRQMMPLSVLLDFEGADRAAVIFWQIRVPRALAAFVGGAGLALGGAVFQAIFRNPLATPYILGGLAVGLGFKAGLFNIGACRASS